MEWKLFEECKGHSLKCDIHETKHPDGAFCLFLGRCRDGLPRERNWTMRLVIRIIREIKEVFRSSPLFRRGISRWKVGKDSENYSPRKLFSLVATSINISSREEIEVIEVSFGEVASWTWAINEKDIFKGFCNGCNGDSI